MTNFTREMHYEPWSVENQEVAIFPHLEGSMSLVLAQGGSLSVFNSISIYLKKKSLKKENDVLPALMVAATRASVRVIRQRTQAKFITKGFHE